MEEAREEAGRIGFPLVIRPSYVLGGAAMQIVYSMDALEQYMSTAVHVSGDSPVLLDHYLSGAIEVDVDALCDGKDTYVAGIMEHIEEAGVHSGDSACVLPPHSLPYRTVREIERQTIKLAKALKVVGLMNIQFALKRNRDSGDFDIYILEVNPRASRTVPFVAKATGVPLAKLAARVMAGEKIASFKDMLEEGMMPDHTAVKAPVFPFSRFQGVDTLLGPEMKSTGEVMGLDRNTAHALAKSQLAAGTLLPKEGTIFVSVRDADKPALLDMARDLLDMGYKLIATGGTESFLKERGITVTKVNKVMEGQPHIVDAIINGEVKMLINTTTPGSQTIKDSFSIRREALMHKIPSYTNMAAAKAAIQAMRAVKAKEITVHPLQDYFPDAAKSKADAA